MTDATFALPSLSSFLETLMDFPSAGEAQDNSVYVSEFDLDLPVEIETREDAGSVVDLALSPPTQMVTTTLMPVFHQLRLRVTEGREL